MTEEPKPVPLAWGAVPTCPATNRVLRHQIAWLPEEDEVLKLSVARGNSILIVARILHRTFLSVQRRADYRHGGLVRIRRAAEAVFAPYGHPAMG